MLPDDFTRCMGQTPRARNVSNALGIATFPILPASAGLGTSTSKALRIACTSLNTAMTDQQHPITPPPELVKQWMTEIWHEGTPVRVAAGDLHIAIQAARWGADMELEACCKWLRYRSSFTEKLRAARRPKPRSLKEQALTILDDPYRGSFCEDEIATIIRALEQLDD